MLTLSTGQIFFAAGIAGLVLAALATAVGVPLLRRQEKRLKEEIWREYR